MFFWRNFGGRVWGASENTGSAALGKAGFLPFATLHTSYMNQYRRIVVR